MSTYSGEVRPTLYKPGHEFPRLLVELDHTPRFLFRTHSLQSRGSINLTCVESEKSASKYLDILQQEHDFSTKMIEKYLRWERSETGNLVSWTSSLLFALQHAIRRHITDLGREDVRISILDTSRLPHGTFIHAVALLEAYNIPNQGKMLHQYYYGECLSQGRIEIPNGAMTTTTLRDVEHQGLYEFYPDLNVESGKRQLCIRVKQLRRKFDKNGFGYAKKGHK